MTKFKVGDKVRIIEACRGVCYETKVGEIHTLEQESDTLMNASGCNCSEKWELAVEHPFKVGDVIVDNDDDEATILLTTDTHLVKTNLVCGQSSGEVRYESWEQVEENIKDEGWKLKDSPTETEELTMDEVCKELGRDIKIKKD